MITVPCPLKPGLMCPAGRVCGEACICPLVASEGAFSMTYRAAPGTRLYEHYDAPWAPAPAGVPQ